ncbi:hypothetical protein W97_05388 [Coniosporium apollinis CBS 100218]|uniref:Uncharacterized protein n=1 Tax=Coniosporium apollinis (strain CBS 100218) TaxID=1168221 RepID=R7YW49_CONA1|nr:uncharacterized protein W97_05388 [Coniosporium apollinis CBS 100218]EON66145.1 hypothetical protein W97_05388 [Coniosporium apollinis CBS 100218]
MKLTGFTALLTLTSSLGAVEAAINGRCTNPSTGGQYQYGVCVRIADCQADGGYTLNNWCPYDGNGVKCCIKSNCHPTRNDDVCAFTSECSRRGGQTLNNQCPGGDNFKCCYGMVRS